MQIQTPRLLRNTSEQFIDSVDAQTLRRLQVSGAYDPSPGTLRHGQNSPAHPSGPSFHFRPLREDDLTVLHEWLLRPHVAAWWGPADSIDECAATTFSRLTNPTQRVRTSRTWTANPLALSNLTPSWGVEEVGGRARPIRERKGLISSWPRRINSAEVLAEQ